ncbi:FMN-binding negative transcriptional regulator [Paenarthrobacter sp. NPDC058040]|uniref:FMN-binding negative transcriptional regulator n=1 Tax=unclassified Paenarthrobacter TaxID=2634190 RepID=UPI0036DEBE89
MYQPHEFRDDDAGRAYAHIGRNPFGILVSGQGESLAATHIPFLLNDDDAPSGLVGHFAVRNEALAGLEDGSPVMAIFPGPHAYVSPTYYRAEKAAPTWNYTAVHLHGIYRRVDSDGLRTILERSVETFENGRAEPWQLDNLPSAAIRSLVRAIVGFRIEATRIEGGYKLSQNKLAEDMVSVESRLRSSSRAGDHSLAEEMRRTGLSGRTSPPSTDPNRWLGPLEDVV